MSFRIAALNVEEFSHLFGKDPEILSAAGVERVVADAKPGYPCRVSLQDAEVGETLLLMNYEHQPAPSPYRSAHAIFVREGATQSACYENGIPQSLRIRLLSVRAFDDCGTMLDADICDGTELESLIERMFADDSVDYLHVHNARRGCYAARIDRL